MTYKKCILLLIAITIIGTLNSSGFGSVEGKVERYTLDNGATLIVLPRKGVPIVSCISLVDVGGVKEEPGITGISHYLEHMAFKGTKTIGTTDYEAEKKALERCHQIFDAILEERQKGEYADPETLEALQNELEEAVEYANQYGIENEFSRILNLNGARNLNAGTSQDMTMYSVSLPSNKLELWMIMEADRFINPVFREFYQEREVILEEKRMIESNPMRKFMNDFASFVFTNHPYRYSVIGEEEDIRNFTVKDIERYFDEHYGAQNIVFAIVGHVDPQKTYEMAQKYLAKIPSKTESGKVNINEPEQKEERHFVSEGLAQPILFVGYHAPGNDDPDYHIYQTIADILGQGRSSRLHRVLVEEKKLAATTFAFSGFPGSVYRNLFLVGVVPNQGVSLEECLAEVEHQIDLMISDNVTTAELDGVKKRALKRSYDRLESSFGLAYQLAYYESFFGDYSHLFRELHRTEAITKNDIARVLKNYFTPERRIIGELRTKGD